MPLKHGPHIQTHMPRYTIKEIYPSIYALTHQLVHLRVGILVTTTVICVSVKVAGVSFGLDSLKSLVDDLYWSDKFVGLKIHFCVADGQVPRYLSLAFNQ